MASDIPVRIDFFADAGNVQQVTQEIRADLQRLLQPRAVPGLDLSGLLGGSGPSEGLRQLDQAATRLAAGSLNDIKKSLDGIATTPGLGNQAAGYAEVNRQLQAWAVANREVLAGSTLLQSAYATLTASAQAGLQGVVDRSRDLASMAGQISAMEAGVTTLFGGLATGALVVASNFEQLEAKLKSVTGSAETAAEKLEFATGFAARTPFDVQSIVQATATLEGFKLKSEEMLPVAANLAAAMGTSLPEATLAVGRAAAGSLEGFESLRSTYAITTSELVKFGLQVDATGGVLARTPEQIEKNRKALTDLITLRYGDAIARQAETLKGALSNAGDSAQTLAAGFGQTLIPIAKIGAQALGGLLNMANAIPAPLKGLAAAGTVAIAGIAGLGAVATGSIAALLLLQANLASTVLNLSAMNIQLPLLATGLNVVNGAIGRVAGSLAATRLAFLGIGGPIIALELLAVAAVDAWEKSSIRVGDAIRDSTRETAKANEFFRSSIDVLNAAGKEAGVTVGIIGDAGAQMDQIQRALGAISKDSLVTAFQESGANIETLKEQLKGTQQEADVLKQRLQQLLVARVQFERVNGQLIFPLDPTPQQREALKTLRNMGVAVEDLDLEIRKTESSFYRLVQNIFIGGEALKAFEQIIQPMREATTESQQLGNFLDLTKQVGTTRSLEAGLTLVNAQIAKMSALPRVGTADLDTLLEKVRTAKNEDKEALLAQIALVQQRTQIQQQIARQAEESAQAEVAAAELALRRRKVIGEAGLKDELYFVQQRLRAAEEGSQEEVQLLERQNELKEQIRAADLKNAQEALRSQIEAAREAQRGAETGGPQGGGALFSALERSVEAWAAANQGLLAQFPELQRELDKFRQDNAMRQQRLEAEALKTALSTLTQRLNANIAEAVGSTQKLTAVKTAISSLQEAITLGAVDESKARTEINRLAGQQLQLEQAISKEKQQQRITLANADLQILAGEQQLLQARKSAGEQVEADITANRKRQVEERLKLIELEKQAAIDAGTDPAFAEQKASRDRTQVQQQDGLADFQQATELAQRQARLNQQRLSSSLEVLDSEKQLLEARKSAGEDVERQLLANQQATLQAKLDIIEAERRAALAQGEDRVTVEAQTQDKLRALRNVEKAEAIKHQQDLAGIKSQVFGKLSPVYSDPTEGLGIRLGTFSLNTPTPRPRQNPVSFREAANAQTPDFRPASPPGAGGAGAAAAAGSIYNVNNSFNGVPFVSPEFTNAVKDVMIRLQADAKLRR